MKALFGALLPLVFFWAIEEFYGLKAALVAGCVVAVIEVVWEYSTKRRVSFLTWASNGLVLGLGTVSFWMDSGVAFKLQPMVMELGMAGMMVVVRFKSSEPFMLRSFKEAPVLDSKRREAALENPEFRRELGRMDLRMVVFFILHGLAVGWAAIWGSTRIWILLKGVLFYVLLALFMLPSIARRSQ